MPRTDQLMRRDDDDPMGRALCWALALSLVIWAFISWAVGWP